MTPQQLDLTRLSEALKAVDTAIPAETIDVSGLSPSRRGSLRTKITSAIDRLEAIRADLSPARRPTNPISEALRALEATLPTETAEVPDLTPQRRGTLRKEIASAISRLERIRADLSDAKSPTYVLDPSDPGFVGRLIAETMLAMKRHGLGTAERFYGSGVYALYYVGNLAIYKPISGTDTPIYVGKADPASMEANTPEEQKETLWKRLNEHRDSIADANNLDVADFECRYLVVKSAWQGTAEGYLIRLFHPAWNKEVKIMKGFGKHGDSPERRRNSTSDWDLLHAGREWATREGNVPARFTVAEIEEKIAKHFEKYQPVPRREERELPWLTH